MQITGKWNRQQTDDCHNTVSRKEFSIKVKKKDRCKMTDSESSQHKMICRHIGSETCECIRTGREQKMGFSVLQIHQNSMKREKTGFSHLVTSDSCRQLALQSSSLSLKNCSNPVCRDGVSNVDTVRYCTKLCVTNESVSHALIGVRTDFHAWFEVNIMIARPLPSCACWYAHNILMHDLRLISCTAITLP